MYSYFCSICNKEHTIIEASDTAIRIEACNTHGHPRVNAMFMNGLYHCYYCERDITKEEFEAAAKRQ